MILVARNWKLTKKINKHTNKKNIKLLALKKKKKVCIILQDQN